MRFVLVGADFEENLGLCMIKASLEQAGHRVRVVPFNEPEELESALQQVLKARPAVVGLGIQFQHRSHDFLRLAQGLRCKGYTGHITCGGHFPTMAWHDVLKGRWGISSVVLYEGERTIVELAKALENGGRLEQIPGLALLSEDGVPFRTADRPMCSNLDDLPAAHRYRHHTRHLGVPFVPISGSRGCWGSCAFCSISTVYRDAKLHGWTRSMRWRSPKALAAEMGALAHAAGGSAIFCFHDDNFLLPRVSDSLQRLKALRGELDKHEPGTIGIVGKCRPDSMTPELARELAELGVIRLYVGIENASEAGARHLERRTQPPQLGAALNALTRAGIYTCYNLLLFEPETTLDDVRDNISFMREHHQHPVNFCRAEAYHGTPLHRRLEAQGRLGGSYLGWDYRLTDDRAELLFRIFAAAFRDRNFAGRGVANRHMSIGYCVKVLEHFYQDPTGARLALARRAANLSHDLTLETADFLEEALRLAEKVDLHDRERIERETALLGLRIASADRSWHAQIDKLMADMDEFARDAKRPTVLRSARKALELGRMIGLAACLGVWSSGCGGDVDSVDPVPGPMDGGSDAKDAKGEADIFMSDCVPPDAGKDVMSEDGVPSDTGVDVQEADIFMSDCVPPDTGNDVMVVDDVPADTGVDVQQADPPPEDSGVDDASPLDAWSDPVPPDASEAKLQYDRFYDTSPRRAVRSDDLPLYHPPQVKLEAQKEGAQVSVRLRGLARGMSTRWQSAGDLEGEGELVVWTPESPDDQVTVAVRSKGGVAVVSLRASDLA